MLGRSLGSEGRLPSIPCPRMDTEYIIKVPRVKRACVLVNTTVSSSKNSVGVELKSFLLSYYEHVKLRIRNVINIRHVFIPH